MNLVHAASVIVAVNGLKRKSCCDICACINGQRDLSLKFSKKKAKLKGMSA